MRKVLVFVSLIVSLVCLMGKQINAAVIDENSPWGVVVWRYGDTDEIRNRVLDSVVSLGCSWIRLSGFGNGEWCGLNPNDYTVNPSDYWEWFWSKLQIDGMNNTDKWIDAANEHGLKVVLATWPNPLDPINPTDYYSGSNLDKHKSQWTSFWAGMATHFKGKGVYDYYVSLESGSNASPTTNTVFQLDGNLVHQSSNIGSIVRNRPWAHKVVVLGNYAYVTAGGAGVFKIGINSSSSNPNYLEAVCCPTAGYAYGIAVDNLIANPPYLYVAEGGMTPVGYPDDRKPGLEVIDISSFSIITSSDIPCRFSSDINGWGWDVAIDGNFAYVADGVLIGTETTLGGNNIKRVNIQDPYHPSEDISYNQECGAKGVAVLSDGTVFAAGGSQGLFKYTSTSKVTYDGNDLGGHLAEQVKLFKNSNVPYACVTGRGYKGNNGGLWVIKTDGNMSNPSDGYVDLLGGYAEGVAIGQQEVSGELHTFAYIANGQKGLRVVDVTDPANPLKLEWVVETVIHDNIPLSGNGYANGVAVSSDGKYVYVANRSKGLDIIDVSGLPSIKPSLVGNGYTFPDNSPNLAYWDQALWSDWGNNWRSHPCADKVEVSFISPPTDEPESHYLDQWYNVFKQACEHDFAYVNTSAKAIHDVYTADNKTATVIAMTNPTGITRCVEGMGPRGPERKYQVSVSLPPYWDEDYEIRPNNATAPITLHPDDGFGINKDGNVISTPLKEFSTVTGSNSNSDYTIEMIKRMDKYINYHYNNEENAPACNIDATGPYGGYKDPTGQEDDVYAIRKDWNSRSCWLYRTSGTKLNIPSKNLLWSMERHVFGNTQGTEPMPELKPKLLQYLSEFLDGEQGKNKAFIWHLLDDRTNKDGLLYSSASTLPAGPPFSHKDNPSGIHVYTDVHEAILETKWDNYSMPDETWLSSDLSNSTGDNNSRKIVADDNGNLHLVFASTMGHNGGGGSVIQYATSTDNGQTWHGKRTLGDGRYPAIAVNANNRISVCWIGVDNQLHYRATTDFLDITDGALMWGKDVVLHFVWQSEVGFCYQSPPAIAVKDNVVHIVAHYVAYTGIFVSVIIPRQFNVLDYLNSPTFFPITNGPLLDYWATLHNTEISHPSISLNYNNPHICWERDGIIKYKYCIGSNWYPTNPATISDVESHNSCIGIKGGEVFIAWETVISGMADIFATHFPVPSGSSPVINRINISNSSEDSRYPVLAEGEKVVWQEDEKIYWTDFNALMNKNIDVPTPSVLYTPINAVPCFPQVCLSNKYKTSIPEGYVGTINLVCTDAPGGPVNTENPGLGNYFFKITYSSQDIIIINHPETFTGILEGTFHWTRDTYLAGDVTIDTGATLTIDPGVKIYSIPFYDDQHSGADTGKAQLTVKGTLIANSVTFVADTTHNDTTTTNSWYGIVVDSGGSVELHGCTIQDAKYGIYANGGSVVAMNNLITNDSIGVYVNSNANLVSLGNIVNTSTYDDGMNSFLNNISWNLVNTDTLNNVYCQADYWGTFDTTQLKIYGKASYIPFGKDLLGANWTIANDTTIYGTYWNVGTFKINSGKTAKVASKSINTTGWIAIEADSFDIQGTFSADSAGWTAGEGPGTGATGASAYGAGGGSYGGRAGAGGCNLQGDTSKYGGYAYGNLENPCDMGSGGGNSDVTLVYKGGAGGGIIRLISSGTINVAGTIKSDGKNGAGSGTKAAGGGSGGSVWLQTNKLTGSGLISAKGGNGSNGSSADGGGGSGGRLNIWYNQSSFTGRIDVSGGLAYDNAGFGQMGTALIHQTDDSVKLVLSPMQTQSSTDSRFGFTKGIEFTDKYIRLTSGDTIFGNCKMRAKDSIIVNASSYIIADEKGYRHGQGIGYGHFGSSSHGAGGAGFGNLGGHGSYYTQGGIGDGGIMYGDSLMTDLTINELGSGGGDFADISGYRHGGGNGGGLIELQCTDTSAGTIVLNGTLSVNGSNGTSQSGYAGGGASGGAVLLFAKYLQGTGIINATGGNGGTISNCKAGGGAGGRVIFYTDSPDSTYSISVSVAGGDSGGTGSTPGGIGTFVRTVLPSEFTPVSYVNKAGLPFVFKMFQNYPNPFRNKTTIKYQIPVTSKVSLMIYDLTGRCVKALVNEEQVPGYYKAELNSKDYPTGIYFAKFKAGEYKETKKLILMK